MKETGLKIVLTARLRISQDFRQPHKIMGKAFRLGLLMVALGVCTVRADIIPTLSSVAPSGSNFAWNYAANVTVDETVNRGDFFTIYDFGNFVAASNVQPTGWTFSSSLLGPTPALVTPTDNPNIPNLTWTYSGTTPIVGSTALGIFSVIASTNQLKVGQFSAEATRNSGPNAGTKVDNIGTVSVPVPEPSALLPVLGICAIAVLSNLPRMRSLLAR